MRNKVLKSIHEGVGETIQIYGVMLLIKRFKSWWMPVCAKMNINARQFVKTCAQCQCGNTRFDKVATKLHPPIPSMVLECSLPHTDEGFVCVCIVVDYFSK